MRRIYVGRLGHHVRERDVERFFSREGKVREVMMKDGYAFIEYEHFEDAEAAVRHLNGRDFNGDRVHVEFARGPPRGRDGIREAGRDGRDNRDGRDDRDRDRGGRPAFGRGSRNGMMSRNPRNDGRGRYDNDRVNRSGGGGGGGISYAEKYGPPRNTDFRVIVENLSSRVSWQDLKDLMRQAGEVTFADAHKRERNMGIVDFASFKDMKHAIDTLNDTEFHGRRIKVFEDKSRRNRRRNDRSRSRSRSRSRTRSHSRERAISSSRSRSKSHSRSRERVPSEVSESRSKSRSRSRSVSKSSRKSEESTNNEETRNNEENGASEGGDMDTGASNFIKKEV